MNIFKKIAGAGDLTDYAEGIKTAGEHEIALSKYNVKETRDYGTVIEAEYLVLKSTSEHVGSIVGDSWFIAKPGLEGEYSRKRALAFGKQVAISLGHDPDAPVTDPATGRPVIDEDGQPVTKVQQVMGQLADKTQPGTGILLRAESRKKTTSKNKREVVNVTYYAQQNTADVIAANRAKIDAARPKATAASVAQAAAPASQQWTPPPVQQAPADPAPAAAPAPGGLLGGLLSR